MPTLPEVVERREIEDHLAVLLGDRVLVLGVGAQLVGEDLAVVADALEVAAGVVVDRLREVRDREDRRPLRFLDLGGALDDGFLERLHVVLLELVDDYAVGDVAEGGLHGRPLAVLADAHAAELDGALLAGLGHDLELEGLHLPAVERVAEGREHLVHVALLDDPVQVHPLELLAEVAQGGARGPVDPGEAAFRVGHEDRVCGVLDDGAVALLGLGELAGADVGPLEEGSELLGDDVGVAVGVRSDDFEDFVLKRGRRRLLGGGSGIGVLRLGAHAFPTSVGV
jgi:hypothetical protein